MEKVGEATESSRNLEKPCTLGEILTDPENMR